MLTVLVLAGCAGAVSSRRTSVETSSLAGAAIPRPTPTSISDDPAAGTATSISRSVALAETFPAVDATPVDALRAWLDANPGASLGAWNGTRTEAWWVRWPDRTELCVWDHGCWAIAPAPPSVDLIDRQRDSGEPGEVFVRLGRATFAVRDGDLVPERIRLRRGERWAGAATARRADEPTITRTTWSGPVRLVDEYHVELGPRSLDDATVLAPGGAFCRRFDDRWACATEELGSPGLRVIQRAVMGHDDGEVWIESEVCDGGTQEWDCFHTLHLFVRDGDTLQERGSLAVGADREVRISEYVFGPDGNERWESDGAGEDIAWDWSPAGPACLEIGSARAARHAWREGRGPVRRTRPRVRYGARVDSIPRWADPSDPAGAPEQVYADLDADLRGDPLRPALVVEDRRGTFRLEDDRWVRTDECGA